MATSSRPITPVLLCGGSGTRLWPLSRRSYPKQFVDLGLGSSLFQMTAMRTAGNSFADPVVVSNNDFRFIVKEQLAAVGIVPQTIILEPEPRNTGPAILAAALKLSESDPDALMLVAPSDHVVADNEAFKKAIDDARVAAEKDQLVTFGIAPTRPETGFGYLEVPEASAIGVATPVVRFVEKPNEAAAVEMLTKGSFLWNAGIFMFKASTLIKAVESLAPSLLAPVKGALEAGFVDLSFFRMDAESWVSAENISIDYSIMEKADNLSVVRYDGGWSDLGGWDAIWRDFEPDENGVTSSGNVTVIDSANSLFRAESASQEVVAIGLNNMIVVSMADAVLVADMSRAQDVKRAVTELKKKKAKQATEFPIDYRPWGWYETLVLGGRFQVKRIHVNPGEALSLQSHHHRSEHWIVVEGTAKITIDDTIKLVTENESVYIPLGAVHRMENPGKVPMVLIEVQTGTYLGEDDIKRYEDRYKRGQGARG